MIRLSKLKINENLNTYFISSFLHRHNFDGLEADWEYPGIRGGKADDKYYLTLFFQVRNLRKKMNNGYVYVL